jgi:hypothetical protein
MSPHGGLFCFDRIDVSMHRWHRSSSGSSVRHQAFSLSRALLSQALIIVYISAIKRSSAFRHPPSSQKKQGEDRKERGTELVVMEREEGGETVALCASTCR